LVPRCFKQERIGDYLLARLKAGEDDLAIAADDLAGVHFSSAEVISASGLEDPIAIVKVEDGLGGDDCVGLSFLTAEGGGDKHAQPEEAGIGDLNANFGGAQLWIKHGSDVVDVAAERAVRIGVDLDACFLADFDARDVVLVDIAKNPYGGEVGNGECGGRA